MPIYKGSQKINTLYVGGRGVKKVYHGFTLVFGKEVFERTFTASGSITFPLSLLSLHVIVVGGGGGGGGGSAASSSAWWSGGGGGSGGLAEYSASGETAKSFAGKTISFTVGGGGAGGGLGSSGGSGGQSKFQNFIANGGAGGIWNNPFAGGSGAGGAGGSASGGNIRNTTGNSGGSGGSFNSGGAGGASLWNGYGAGGGGGFNSSGGGSAGCVYIRYEY